MAKAHTGASRVVVDSFSRYSNGETHHGEFANGVKEGPGVHMFENGDQWEGNWVDDLPSGLGLYTVAETRESFTSAFDSKTPSAEKNSSKSLTAAEQRAIVDQALRARDEADLAASSIFSLDAMSDVA